MYGVLKLKRYFPGFNRFSEDIKAMLGFQPGYFWKACWAVVSPLFLWVSSKPGS